MAIPGSSTPPAHYSQGVVTNPNGTSNFAVDTGAITPGGVFECLLTVGGVPATAFTVQRRNAANSGNVGTPFVIYTVADSSSQYVFNLELAAGERVRVLPSSETGDVCANLVMERLL